MSSHQILYTKRQSLDLSGSAQVMGILNLTPDSFSDGGAFFSMDAAVQQFHRMVSEGASIIDVGGESTRPGYVPVAAAEEIARVVPFIEQVRAHTEVLISIDTSKAEVADAALAAGADIVNDVWGAQGDAAMADVIAQREAACVLMHNRKSEAAGKGDVIAAILQFWQKSVDIALKAGVRADAILLDPGLGFGKTYEENWEVIRRLPDLIQFGYPVLLGASRKSMIAKLLNLADPKDRLSGTLATTVLGVQAGVACVRVHDVQENAECVRVAQHCKR